MLEAAGAKVCPLPAGSDLSRMSSAANVKTFAAGIPKTETAAHPMHAPNQTDAAKTEAFALLFSCG